MNRRIIALNVLASVALQIVNIVCGFLMPKIILNYFGSEVNGLLASITQFLGFLQILDGGVGGLIMASLYKPIVKKDYEKVSSVLSTSRKFARKIITFYIGYVIIVAIGYPFVVKTGFSWLYLCSLTVILATTSIIQYYFGLTYRLLIQADQKVYIISFYQIAYNIINVILVFISVVIHPSVHSMKLITCLLCLSQPMYFISYVKKHYNINYKCRYDKNVLSSRWSALGQNIAYYIHTNTDIVVLTLFATIKDVSLYSVYLSVVIAVRSLVLSASTAIVPSIGNIMMTDDNEKKNRVFDAYEFVMLTLAFTFFTCCMLLITPFVDVYTLEITDYNYHNLLFGIMLSITELIYCGRDPYVSVAYACKMFRETSKYAYVEAVINIAISVILVYNFGIIGVAIGTIVSMLYRLICHIAFLKKRILNRPVSKAAKNIFTYLCGAVICGLIYFKFLYIPISSYRLWFILAMKTMALSIIVYGTICLLFFRHNLKQIIVKPTKRR